jgi:hypothetical protein
VEIGCQRSSRGRSQGRPDFAGQGAASICLKASLASILLIRSLYRISSTSSMESYFSVAGAGITRTTSTRDSSKLRRRLVGFSSFAVMELSIADKGRACQPLPSPLFEFENKKGK